MIDCRRLILNLVFFFLGVLIPLLAFQSAFAGTYDCSSGTLFDLADYNSAADYTTGDHVVYSPPNTTKTYEYVIGTPVVTNTCTASTLPELSWSTNPTGYVYRTQGEAGTGGCGPIDKPTNQVFIPFVYVTGSYSSSECSLATIPEPEPSIPAQCSNGVPDEGEEGADCGGICPSVCVSLQKCATDEKVETVLNVGTGEITYSCSKTVSPDTNNQCPSTFTRVTSDNLVDGQWVTSSECYKETGPAVEFTGSESLADAWDADPSNVPASTADGWSKKSLSVVKMNGGETVVDNGDGTETASFSWTKTDDKGNTTNGSASVNRPAGSSAGTGFDAGGDGGPGIAPGYVGQIQEDQETDPEENPGNYAFGEGTVASGEFDEGVPGRVGAVFSGFVDSVKAAPVYAAFTSLTSVPTSTNSVSGLSLGSWGSVDIDFSLFQSAFASLGWVLVGLALWRSYKLIVANK